MCTSRSWGKAGSGCDSTLISRDGPLKRWALATLMPIELLGMADASTCRIGHDDSMGPAGQRQGCASPGFARP